MHAAAASSQHPELGSMAGEPAPPEAAAGSSQPEDVRNQTLGTQSADAALSQLPGHTQMAQGLKSAAVESSSSAGDQTNAPKPTPGASNRTTSAVVSSETLLGL